MKIGDKVQRAPETFGQVEQWTKIRKQYVGRVVYIHPEGRYHTVEFSLRGGKVRECFLDA